MIGETAMSKDARFWNRFARRYAASQIRDPEGYERTLARTAQLIGGAVGQTFVDGMAVEQEHVTGVIVARMPD